MSARCLNLTLTGAGGYTVDVPKANFTASTDPTVSSDDSAGYVSGSVWVNVTGGKVWVCQSNTTGAAVWIQTGPGSAGAAGSAGNQGGHTFSWLWNTATTGNASYLEFNNATFASVTTIYAGTTCNSGAIGASLGTILKGDYLICYAQSNYNQFAIFKCNGTVTGTGGTLATIPVSFVQANGGVFTNLTNVFMSIAHSGAAGSGPTGGTQGTTPTVAGGTGLRSAGLPGTISMDTGSDDEAGSITFTPGGTPLASNIVGTVTFSTAYANTPKAVLLAPANEAAAVLAAGQMPYVKRANTTSAKFEIWSGTTALVQGTSYNFHYAVRCAG